MLDNLSLKNIIKLIEGTTFFSWASDFCQQKYITYILSKFWPSQKNGFEGHTSKKIMMMNRIEESRNREILDFLSEK